MTENTIHPKYRPDIDGLRALAVLSVVLFHGFPNALRGGFAGVDVFFVISGFLISTIIFQNLDRGSFSIGDFYVRRIRRIFPALALVLFSVLIFGWLCLFPDELHQLGRHAASSAGFIQNFTLWKEVGYFDNASETKPLLHIWSLGIEEQFYFIWPLLLWGTSKLSKSIGAGKHKVLLYFLATVLVFVVSFILNVNLVKVDPSKTFYLPQYRFFEMALGGILAWWVLYQPKIRVPFFNSQNVFLKTWLTETRIKNFLSFFGLTILLVVFYKFSKETVFPGKKALLPIFATVFIIWAGPHSWLNRKVLSNKILVWFGLISFPLYLWHWPILSFGRIIYGEMPTRQFRLIAIAISILLAWLTVKIVEKPFRFGNHRLALKIATLCLLVFGAGGLGLIVNEMNFDDTHTSQNLRVKRRGFEFALGTSLAWYRGQNDWLFLGNAYNQTVQKLVGAISPSESDVNTANKPFLELAKVGQETNTKIILIIAPNKESIYPEYLPNEFVPSKNRYIGSFLDQLNGIPNLTVYNPIPDLLRLKETEGLLYYRTNTHWNDKGGFFVYSGFSNAMDLPIPQVEFQLNGTHAGDLLDIGKLKDFPLHPGDSWQVAWKSTPEWIEKEIPGIETQAYGKTAIVNNFKPLSNKKVWVSGDSFAASLRKYLNATFKEVRYVGHWDHKVKDLPQELSKVKDKPDMLIIVLSERSF
jgi:peptidoglycan/LPS O-acetylase OafA/YrhL